MSAAQNKRNRKARKALKAQAQHLIRTIRCQQEWCKGEHLNLSRTENYFRNHKDEDGTGLIAHCEERLSEAYQHLEETQKIWYSFCEDHPLMVNKLYKRLPFDFPQNSIWD